MVTMASNLTSTVSCSPTQGDVITTTTTSAPKKTSENRRSNKPIMEKRRRARINNSLNELKTLILDATKKDPARHSKLEKADILEMTVKHLESLQRQQVAMSAVTDPNVINKFKAGFSECAGEVGRFPGLEPAVRRRLLQHLAHCLGSSTPHNNNNNSNNNKTSHNNSNINNSSNRHLPLNADLSNRIPNIQRRSQQEQTTANLQVRIIPHSNNDNASSVGSIFLSTGSSVAGLRLLPTRLPNGDIALVLPSTSGSGQHGFSSSSPSSSSTVSVSSSSPPPLNVLLPSGNSPISFERLSVDTTRNSNSSSPVSSSSCTIPASVDDICHSPSSSSVYSSGPVSPLSTTGSVYYDGYNNRSPSPPAKPLALVVREEISSYYSEEDKPWRPW